MQPTLKEYFKLLLHIFREIIMRYRYVTIASVICTICVMVSTYYLTLVAEASCIVLDSSSTVDFKKRVSTFLYYSLFALSLKHIPLSFFTYLIQLVSRNKFVECLRNYMNMPYYKFHKKTPGEIRFTIFLKSLSYPMCAQIIIFDFTSFVGIIFFTFIKTYQNISIYVALIFSIFPILYIWYIIIYLKKRLVYRTKNLIEQEKTSAVIYDKLSNYDVIKAFNLESSQLDSLRESVSGQIDAQVATDIFSAKGKYLGRYIFILPYVLILVVYILFPEVMKGKLFLEATLMYTSMSVHIKKLGTQLYKLSTFLNQIGYDGEMVTHIDSSNIPTQMYFQDCIEFKNVNLLYEEKVVIRNINCTIKKNEKIAVVGRNGEGKSSFIKAILGFTLYNGTISIDNFDIKQLSNKQLFSMISYISQDDYTSDDTILNNLKLGNKDATRDRIEEVAKEFKAHDIIMSLENGYDTEAGIRGNRLSGGQRQAFSIVRAGIKDSAIFIFDEATSAIDSSYEKELIKIFFDRFKNKTVVMIIHENEYLKYFDRIFFLSNQSLADSGTYEELIERNDEFRRFIET